MSTPVSIIKKAFLDADEKILNSLILEYDQDSRKSVQQIVLSARKKLIRIEAKRLQLNTLCQFDVTTCGEDVIVIGVDEAGRGPLAGPVVAATCAITYHPDLIGLDDSKKLPEAERNRLFNVIKQHAITYGIGIVDAPKIDQINILEATKLAMYKALKDADDIYSAIITDHVMLNDVKQAIYPIVKGDQKSVSVAAASVLAKVTRDSIMKGYHEQYEAYGFNKHKGYGTADHYKAIQAFGITPIHRRSFLKGLI